MWVWSIFSSALLPVSKIIDERASRTFFSWEKKCHFSLWLKAFLSGLKARATVNPWGKKWFIVTVTFFCAEKILLLISHLAAKLLIDLLRNWPYINNIYGNRRESCGTLWSKNLRTKIWKQKRKRKCRQRQMGREKNYLVIISAITM